MDETNTVNDVTEGIVDLPSPAEDSGAEADISMPSAPETAEPVPQQEEIEPPYAVQTPEQNAWYASQRRAAEAAKVEAQRAKTENDRLMDALHGYGYRGSPEDIADQLEATKRQVSVEDLRADRAADQSRVEAAVRQSPEFLRMQSENEALQAIAAKSIFERDLAAINKAFPDAKVKDVSALGDGFHKLRAAGIDTLTAYAASRQAQAAAKSPIPPAIGALGTSSAREKDFYTPAEVDRLTAAELDDPKVWARARNSMTKWK